MPLILEKQKCRLQKEPVLAVGKKFPPHPRPPKHGRWLHTTPQLRLLQGFTELLQVTHHRHLFLARSGGKLSRSSFKGIPAQARKSPL